MRITSLAALLSLALGACTTSSDGQSVPNVVAIAGTPQLIGFKAAFCPATVILATPVAAFSSLTRPWPPVPVFYNGGDSGQDVRQGVNDAIIANCGPPYYVTP